MSDFEDSLLNIFREELHRSKEDHRINSLLDQCKIPDQDDGLCALVRRAIAICTEGKTIRRLVAFQAFVPRTVADTENYAVEPEAPPSRNSSMTRVRGYVAFLCLVKFQVIQPPLHCVEDIEQLADIARRLDKVYAVFHHWARTYPEKRDEWWGALHHMLGSPPLNEHHEIMSHRNQPLALNSEKSAGEIILDSAGAHSFGPAVKISWIQAAASLNPLDGIQVPLLLHLPNDRRLSPTAIPFSVGQRSGLYSSPPDLSDGTIVTFWNDTDLNPETGRQTVLAAGSVLGDQILFFAEPDDQLYHRHCYELSSTMESKGSKSSVWKGDALIFSWASLTGARRVLQLRACSEIYGLLAKNARVRLALCEGLSPAKALEYSQWPPCHLRTLTAGPKTLSLVWVPEQCGDRELFAELVSGKPTLGVLVNRSWRYVALPIIRAARRHLRNIFFFENGKAYKVSPYETSFAWPPEQCDEWLAFDAFEIVSEDEDFINTISELYASLWQRVVEKFGSIQQWCGRPMFGCRTAEALLDSHDITPYETEIDLITALKEEPEDLTPLHRWKVLFEWRALHAVEVCDTMDISIGAQDSILTNFASLPHIKTPLQPVSVVFLVASPSAASAEVPCTHADTPAEESSRHSRLFSFESGQALSLWSGQEINEGCPSTNLGPKHRDWDPSDEFCGETHEQFAFDIVAASLSATPSRYTVLSNLSISETWNWASSVEDAFAEVNLVKTTSGAKTQLVQLAVSSMSGATIKCERVTSPAPEAFVVVQPPHFWGLKGFWLKFWELYQRFYKRTDDRAAAVEIVAPDRGSRTWLQAALQETVVTRVTDRFTSRVLFLSHMVPARVTLGEICRSLTRMSSGDRLFVLISPSQLLEETLLRPLLTKFLLRKGEDGLIMPCTITSLPRASGATAPFNIAPEAADGRWPSELRWRSPADEQQKSTERRCPHPPHFVDAQLCAAFKPEGKSGGGTCAWPVEALLPCGHQQVLFCFQKLWEQACREPCGAILACGHTCTGTCGSCREGRLHIRCQMRCGRYRSLCGHQCTGLCHDEGSECPPCMASCGWVCRRDGTNCCATKCSGLICKPCWHCERWIREGPQAEVWDALRPWIPPCDKQNPRCGHPCSGYFGETRCPNFCRSCGEIGDVSTYFGSEHSKSRYVKLECGHEFEVDGLFEWITRSRAAAKDGLKCPVCSAVSPFPAVPRPKHVYSRTSEQLLAELAEHDDFTRRYNMANVLIGTPNNGHNQDIVEFFRDHTGNLVTKGMLKLATAILTYGVKGTTLLQKAEGAWQDGRLELCAFERFSDFVHWLADPRFEATAQQRRDADKELQLLDNVIRNTHRRKQSDCDQNG